MAPKLLYIIAFISIALLQLLGAWIPVTAQYVNVASFACAFALLYLLEKKTIEDAKIQRDALAEAGKAITDTLKVAFENLKKVASTGVKVQTKLADHDTRIHRLERNTQSKGADSRVEAIKQAMRNRSDAGTPNTRRPAPATDDLDDAAETEE